MHRILLLLVLASLAGLPLFSQPYFQQSVRYDLRVRLDPAARTVAGDLALTYRNNSPDTLPQLVFHLWPRAFSGPGTAFNRQALRRGRVHFHFAEPAQRGTLDSLDWRVDGSAAGFTFSPRDPDLGTLDLPVPLAPGDSVTVTTPFRVRVPASWSRLGRVGRSYQMTQWYPKPAVYDRDGWHPMPYLDQGEFYGEFGDFRVAITVPADYTVAATGTLETAAERERLLRMAAGETADAPARTLVYTARRVHDFAWFADPDFRVRHDTLHLRSRPETASRPPVDVWAFYTAREAELWTQATDYLKRSARFYSEHLGDYPYPQVTAVQSFLSAGAGMEYPMITVIGGSGSAYALDEILAHEVGHNWFYGILGSNERDHAWLDEGLNTYYEARYTQRYYPDRDGRYEVVPGRSVDFDLLGYSYAARQGKDQAPATTSEALSERNYWISAYAKPRLILERLADSVGTDALDDALRHYYQRWQFRHPRPADFYAALGERIALPAWFRPAFESTREGDFNRSAPRPAPGPRRLRVGLITDQEAAGTRQLFVLPLAGYNTNDGFLLGAGLHNRTLEPRRLEWAVAPLYGFGSGRVAGFAGAQFRWPRPATRIRQLTVSAGTQRFADFTPTAAAFDGEVYGYRRHALRIEAHSEHPPAAERETHFYARYLHLDRERPRFGPDGTLLEATNRLRDNFLVLGWERTVTRALRPATLGFRLEYKGEDPARLTDESHLRFDATVTGGVQYRPGKFFRWRGFAGYFLANQLRDRANYPASGLSLVDNAASDYRYDGLYLGRNSDGLYQQQLGRRQGGFRAPIAPAFNFGRSNDYLTSVNLDADLPLPLPVGLFVDAGLYGYRPTTNSAESGEFNWVAGLSVTALGGRVGAYLPLVADPDTRLLLEQNGDWLQRLSFRLSLTEWLPWRWIDGLL